MLRRFSTVGLIALAASFAACEADEEAFEGVPLDQPEAIEEAPLADTVDMPPPVPTDTAQTDTLQMIDIPPPTDG